MDKTTTVKAKSKSGKLIINSVSCRRVINALVFDSTQIEKLNRASEHVKISILIRR